MAINQSASTALTITAGNLAAAAARSSAAVTPDTTKNITAIMLTVSVLTTSTAPSSTSGKQVQVYGYMSEDGTNYTGASGVADDVDGTDKALTALGAPSNLILLGTIQLNAGANAVTHHGTFEVTRAFGCVPRKWGIVLYNDAGTALGATVTASYTETSYS